MNSVVRLTDRPDITIDVYRGRKTTKQQQMYFEGQFVIFQKHDLPIFTRYITHTTIHILSSKRMIKPDFIMICD